MARDPLAVLQGVRRRSVDQARHALGACLRAETAVEARLQGIEEAARRDRLATLGEAEACSFAEMFALRRRVGQAERREAEAALIAARAESMHAREAVGAARSAAEAVEAIITEGRAAAAVQEDRRAQHALDDMARDGGVRGRFGLADCPRDHPAG